MVRRVFNAGLTLVNTPPQALQNLLNVLTTLQFMGTLTKSSGFYLGSWGEEFFNSPETKYDDATIRNRNMHMDQLRKEERQNMIDICNLRLRMEQPMKTNDCFFLSNDYQMCILDAENACVFCTDIPSLLAFEDDLKRFLAKKLEYPQCTATTPTEEKTMLVQIYNWAGRVGKLFQLGGLIEKKVAPVQLPEEYSPFELLQANLTPREVPEPLFTTSTEGAGYRPNPPHQGATRQEPRSNSPTTPVSEVGVRAQIALLEQHLVRLEASLLQPIEALNKKIDRYMIDMKSNVEEKFISLKASVTELRNVASYRVANEPLQLPFLPGERPRPVSPTNCPRRVPAENTEEENMED